MRRRSGSAYSSRSGSGSGVRILPTAPGASGPCCQESPIVRLLLRRAWDTSRDRAEMSIAWRPRCLWCLVDARGTWRDGASAGLPKASPGYVIRAHSGDGKMKLMDLHRGTGPHTDFLPRGRQAQLEQLRHQLDAVRTGRGGIVLVVGMPGLGKTVLLDATDAMARERDIRIFRGTANLAARVIPFGPLLEALVSAPDAPVDPAVLRDLSQFPDQRFWLLRELQEGLERAALRAPVLILVDDVQWADEATLAALVTLTSQLATHRILWVLAARPSELSTPAGAALERITASGALEMSLTPLDRDAVAAIAEDVLGGAPDRALLKALAGVHGHPF